MTKLWNGALATERAGRHDESVEQADDESSEHEQADDESAEQADESKHWPGQAVGAQCTPSLYSRTFTFSIYFRF